MKMLEKDIGPTLERLSTEMEAYNRFADNNDRITSLGRLITAYEYKSTLVRLAICLFLTL